MSDSIIPVSTSQEIETKKVNINKLFTDFWFRVPEYQRSYKWGPEEIDDLLNWAFSVGPGIQAPPMK